jgi:hypothetical protein
MVMIYLVGRIEEIAEACRFGAEVACSTVVPVVYVRVTVASVRCPPVRCRCVGPCKKLPCATGLVSCRASRRYRLHGGTVGDTWSCLAVFGTLRATQISGGSSSTVSTIHAEKEKRGRKERCGRATGVWAKGTPSCGRCSLPPFPTGLGATKTCVPNLPSSPDQHLCHLGMFTAHWSNKNVDYLFITTRRNVD